MKAVGYFERGLTLEDERALMDLEIPDPGPPAGHDLRVRVCAVSVNPRDIKSRKALAGTTDKPMIIGYDASGVVDAVGPDVTLFHPGDEVFYAGVINRQGSNAEFQFVDERIVGRKPRTLDHATAASLPLTMLTAYETLFDRLCVPTDSCGKGQTILILGGAGGVPSSAIQLARQMTQLTVIATASRPESERWVREWGAHHVVNHAMPLPEQLASLGLTGAVQYIFSTHTDAANWAQMAAFITPQGRIALIDDPEPLDLRVMKLKSISIHWEAMFTRPMFGTPDMIRQHEILNLISEQVDAGRVRATAQQNFGTINAANLRRAHAAIETGRVVGKIVLSGF